MKLINELIEGDEEAWRFRSVGQPDEDEKEVLVQGLGRYQVKHIKAQVARMTADIAKEAAKGDNWKTVNWKMKHSALHAFIETLAKLEEQKNVGQG